MAYNVFEAKPREFSGLGLIGTKAGQYPGFHTTSEKGIAFTYAQAKLQDILPTDIEELSKPLPDYPVIVTLDMRGLTAQVDYDAVEIVLPELVPLLNTIANKADPLGELELLRHGIEEAVPDSLMGALGYMSNMDSQTIFRRLEAYLEQFKDPEAEIEDMLKELTDQDLMAVTQQFRYTKDVDERRLLSVSYARPVFGSIVKEEEYDTDIPEIEAHGYAVLTEENVFDQALPFVEMPILERSPTQRGQMLFEFVDLEPRIEWHGTTYKNLKRAAGDLLFQALPVPPLPFVGE